VPAQGFAAIDLETTGLSPHADRVIEIAVIQLDRDLVPYGELTTLINPGRDIGATHVHHITTRDVAGAPRFEQVAPMLLDFLRGRVIVAHNVQFDLRFLHAEFARIGIGLPELPVMCTMQLAPQYLPGIPARSLAACCLAAGIQVDGAHAAAADARAVAQLLACYFVRVTSCPPSGYGCWPRRPASRAQRCHR
jgi:DNA polymerase III subunit epsilon